MKKLLFLFLMCSPLVGMNNPYVQKIMPNSVRMKSNLGGVDLFHNGKNFVAEYNNQRRVIPNYDIDKDLANIAKSPATLKSFLNNNGRIGVGKYNNGDLHLKAQVPGDGGGLILAWGAYWAVKIVGNSIKYYLIAKVAEKVDTAYRRGNSADKIAATALAAGTASIVTGVLPQQQTVDMITTLCPVEEVAVVVESAANTGIIVAHEISEVTSGIGIETLATAVFNLCLPIGPI
jgi:hypothetical protein